MSTTKVDLSSIDFNARGTCFTCVHSPVFPGRANCDALTLNEEVDAPIVAYCEASGVIDDLPFDDPLSGWPTRTDFACPAWSPRGAS